ncbi:hypothetical protein YC2023_114818 [Brassica napus]
MCPCRHIAYDPFEYQKRDSIRGLHIFLGLVLSFHRSWIPNGAKPRVTKQQEEPKPKETEMVEDKRAGHHELPERKLQTNASFLLDRCVISGNILSLLPCRICESYQATIKHPDSIIGPSATLCVTIHSISSPSSRIESISFLTGRVFVPFKAYQSGIRATLLERLDIRFKDHIKTTRDVSDPKRRLLQFDVQEICDNFEKGMMKALKDISKSHKKSTSTSALVAKPSFFTSKKSKGKSETHVEELKDFSDFLPTFDEYDEEPIESLMICEKNCDFRSLESEFMNDNEQTIVELTVLQPEHPSSLVLSQQVFEEEPLDYLHQGPRLDTKNPMDEDLGPIFDEEDEPGPVFDEEATSITTIGMESHLCFDPGTTPAPLTPDLQEHCEKSDLINSPPNMFVKISSHDLIRVGLDKMKDFCVSKSVFENMINSFKLFKPEKLLDQKCFQKGNGIKSEFILSFDQFLKHSKGFDRFEKSFELDLKQTDFCARKSFDSFVFKKNGFDLSSSKHAMITDNLIASSCALDDFLIKKMLEQRSLETETDFCDSVLQPDLLSSETNKTWHFLRSILGNCVVLSLDDIVVYNTFFEKHLQSLIVDSQSKLKLVCSDVDQDMHDLKMNTIVAYLEKILVCNVYFDVHLDKLKCVLLVLVKDILIFYLNKYLSCTFDPGLLVFVLSIQEIQVHSLRNESIDRAQQPEIWRSFVVQTGYLGDASDMGSVQNRNLNIQKVFCHESNFHGKPTHKGFTEAWNHMKIFTEEGVMNFPNWRFSSPSIREYQTSKGDSGPRKKRPEPKPILREQKDKQDNFPRRASNDGRQRTWNYLMKTTSKLQGSFCPIFLFTEFPLNFNSFVSDFFPFDIGT